MCGDKILFLDESRKGKKSMALAWMEYDRK